MLSLLYLEDEGYAPNVLADLQVRVGRSVSRGALYRSLDRLEEKGFLEWRLDAPTADRGGHSRRRYRVTRPGMAALRSSRDALLTLWGGIEKALDSR